MQAYYLVTTTRAALKLHHAGTFAHVVRRASRSLQGHTTNDPFRVQNNLGIFQYQQLRAQLHSSIPPQCPRQPNKTGSGLRDTLPQQGLLQRPTHHLMLPDFHMDDNLLYATAIASMRPSLRRVS